MIPAVLPVYNRSDFALVRGEGAYAWTDDGRKMLDFAAGIAVNGLGHCHPALVKALQDQAETLWHVSNLYRVPGQEELAKKLTENSFADSVFFCNSGSEAIELAIKMVRKYFDENGQPDRYRIITCDGAFHGRTMAAISAAGKEKLTAGFAPLLEGFDVVPFGDLAAMEKAIGPNTAAIMFEPIQGEGGIRTPDDTWLKEVRALCDRKGLLLVLDEIQCGVGRTGKLFAHEFAGIRPDIMAVAKGIGGGFPLGACLAVENAAKAMTAGSHGSTYGGNPLAMAVGNAVMDVMLEKGFLPHVVEIGEILEAELQKLVKEFPDLLKEVRGRGLMLGLKFHKAEPRDVMQALRKEGLLTAPAADNTLRILPPLTIEQEHINEAMGMMRKALKGIAA